VLNRVLWERSNFEQSAAISAGRVARELRTEKVMIKRGGKGREGKGREGKGRDQPCSSPGRIGPAALRNVSPSNIAIAAAARIITPRSALF